MQESGKPIELGLRLKLQNGQIVEAEHLIARNLSAVEPCEFADAAAGLACPGATRRADSRATRC